MWNTPKNRVILAGLSFALAAALLGPQLVVAQSDASSDESQAWAKPFADVDINQDNQLAWIEIDHAYDESLSSAGWGREALLEAFDENGNALIDQEEYSVFVTSLRRNLAAREVADEVVTWRQGLTEVIPLEGRYDRLAPGAGATAMASEAVDGPVAPGFDTLTDVAESPMVGAPEQPIVPGDHIALQTLREGVQPVSLAALNDKEVVNLRGEKIGEVEDIVREPTSTEVMFVIETGGLFELGDTEVLVPAAEVYLVDEQLVWESRAGAEALREREAYDDDDGNYVSVIESGDLPGRF